MIYRILNEHREVRERRNKLRYPNYAKPELVATTPTQLWSLDIPRLPGSTKGTCYQPCVIINVFSRYVPGWLLADPESATLARRLVHEACRKQKIKPNQLTLQANRGSSMKSMRPCC